MFISKTATLRSLLPEQEPLSFSDDDYMEDQEEMEKEAAYTFQPEPLKEHNIFLPDDKQNRMWSVYKFGGEWDLGEGEGKKFYPPKSPQILGHLTGTFTRQMHKATKIAKGGSKATPGPVNKRHWGLMSNAIKTYDPTLFVEPLPGDQGGFRPKSKFTTWVIGSTQPDQMGGGAVGQDVVARITNNKALGSEYISMAAKSRPIMEQYAESMGHPIPVEELARQIGETTKKTSVLMRAMAPEYDPEDTIDEKNSMAELSLMHKDAIRTVYADSNENEKRIIEWMFPLFHSPKIIPPRSAMTSQGKVTNNWMAETLGITKEKMSRIRKNKIIPAIKVQAGLTYK